MTDNSPTAKIAAEYLTVVYRVAPGDEARAILEANAWAVAGWSHAIEERDGAQLLVTRLTRELAEARQQAALQALADSSQELGGYEAAKPDVDSIMALADEMVRKSWAEGERGHEYDAARTNLRAALEGKHHE